MQPTSYERREMAEQLRKHNGHYYEELVNMSDSDLADLIDPTCSMACRGSFTASHDFTRWECGECGAYAFTPKKVLAPRYCPGCGARVVSGDE